MPAPGRRPAEFKDRAIRLAPGRLGRPGSAPCSSRCACRSRQGRSEAPAGARSARLCARRVGSARGSGRAPRPPSARGPAQAGPGAEARAQAAAARTGARGGAVCPNLLQRPGPGRSTGRETLIFRASPRRRSRPGAPLQQIRTRPRPGSPQEPHPHHNPPRELLAETSSPETRRVPRTCRRRPPTVSPVREHSRAPLSPGSPRPPGPPPASPLSADPALDRGSRASATTRTAHRGAPPLTAGLGRATLLHC